MTRARPVGQQTSMEDESSRLDRSQQFSKTKFCKFEQRGMCTKGPSCPFAHTQEEMKPLPDLRRTKLCAELLQSGVCKKWDCTFAHSKEELRATSAFHKTKLCRFMQAGRCTLGPKCSFAHSPSEIRPQQQEPQQMPQQSPQQQPQHLQAPPLPQPPGLSATTAIGLIGKPPGLVSWDAAEEAQPTVNNGLRASSKIFDLEPAYVKVPPSITTSFSEVGSGSHVWDWDAPLLKGRSLHIDQSDHSYQIKCLLEGAVASRQFPIRAVRTSESTLCTLGDEPLSQAWQLLQS